LSFQVQSREPSRSVGSNDPRGKCIVVATVIKKQPKLVGWARGLIVLVERHVHIYRATEKIRVHMGRWMANLC
jgi:hypothetical protein